MASVLHNYTTVVCRGGRMGGWGLLVGEVRGLIAMAWGVTSIYERTRKLDVTKILVR